MQAWVVERCAPIDEQPLSRIERELPLPGPGQIRVRVSCCGVCRTDLHLARLHERLTFASKPALETLDALAQQLQSHGGDAKAMALKQLMQMTHTQGLVMAFADVFFLLTLLFVVLAGLAVIIKRPPGLGAA